MIQPRKMARDANRYFRGVIRNHTLSRSKIIRGEQELKNLALNEFKSKGVESIVLRNGIILHLRRGDLVSGMIYARRNWHGEDVTPLFNKIMRRCRVFVDIGANIGWYTLHAAKMGAKVYSFEPEGINFGLLCKSVGANGYSEQVTVSRVALADFDGPGVLSTSPDDSGNNSLIWRDGDSAESVECRRLDSILPTLESDLAKIDVQGAEPNVLLGAWQTILDGRLKRIIMEWNPSVWGKYQDLMDEMFKLYRVFAIDRNRLSRLRAIHSSKSMPQAGDLYFETRINSD